MNLLHILLKLSKIKIVLWVICSFTGARGKNCRVLCTYPIASGRERSEKLWTKNLRISELTTHLNETKRGIQFILCAKYLRIIDNAMFVLNVQCVVFGFLNLGVACCIGMHS